MALAAYKRKSCSCHAATRPHGLPTTLAGQTAEAFSHLSYPLSPQSLQTELLGSQRRDRVSVRVDLCQEFGGERRPGPLHLFVNGRRLFALQLYLLLLCLAKGDPWDKEMSGTSWVLALDQQGHGAESKVSRKGGGHGDRRGQQVRRGDRASYM